MHIRPFNLGEFNDSGQVGNECPCKSFIIASIKIKNQSEEQDNVMLMTESSNLKIEVLALIRPIRMTEC